MIQNEFQQLATQLRPSLLQIGMIFLHDEDEAEDIAQESLLRLWTYCFQQGGKVEKPKLWTLTVARNLCLSELRRRQTDTRLTLDEDNDVTDDCYTQQLVEAKETQRWLKMALMQLTSAERRVFVMSQQQGLENNEIAQVLGVTEGYVRTALSRARLHLMDLYKKRR